MELSPDMELSSRDAQHQRFRLLYRMMIIAAIAVTVFSIIGIASIMGWMPHAMRANP